MINVTRLLCGAATPGDGLRYGERTTILNAAPMQPTVHHRPVVVWNCVRRCNLHCAHCYSSSQDKDYSGELSTAEAQTLIDELARYKIPVLLFSGGEPFLRHDIFELLPYAASQGLRVGLSTNGTLITDKVAGKLKEIGVQHVGISLDGLEKTNDRFRGKKGAFRMAVQGMRNSKAAGLRVSLRLTLTRYNYPELADVFDELSQEVDRICIYHLAYAGRAKHLVNYDLTHQETREAMDVVFEKTQKLHEESPAKEVLTVDNHADGAYLYLKVAREQPERADEVYRLLALNGGNSSGVGIGCIDNLGNVHPDQFWWHHTLGNIKERRFGDIWDDTSDPLMQGLKDRRALLKGRCTGCRFLDVCNGNLRVRAEAVHDDVWQDDPACYLTDQEIGIAVAGRSWSI